MGAFCSSCHPFSVHHHSAFDDDDSRRDRLPIDPETPGHRILLPPLSTATSSTRLTSYDTMSQTAPFFIRSCAKKVNAILSGRRKGGTPIELQRPPADGHCYAYDVERDDEDEDTMFSMHQRSSLTGRDHDRKDQDAGSETCDHQEDACLTWDPHDILHHTGGGARRAGGPGIRESTSSSSRPHHQTHPHQALTPSHHVIEFPLLDPILQQEHQHAVVNESATSRSRLFPGSWFFSPKKVHDRRIRAGLAVESEEASPEVKKPPAGSDQHAVIMTDMEWDDYGLEKV